MRKCPLCAEEIQDAAIKCRHCGSMLTQPAFAPTSSPEPPPPGAVAAERPKGDLAKLAGSGCLVFVLLFGGMIYFGRSGDKPAAAQAIAAAPAQREASPPARKKAAPVEQVQAVSITQLLGEYKDNEIRADNRFKDRLIEVSGTVDDTKKDLLGDIYVTIGTGAQFEIPQVQCFFSEDHTDQVSRLSKGQRVTVRGRVDGLMMNVLIKDCVLQ